MKMSCVIISRWIRGVARFRFLRLVPLAFLMGFVLAPGSAPEPFKRISGWPGETRGPTFSVATAGHYAYAAIGEGGVAVLDLSNPAKPVRVGGYQPPGRTERVQVVGSRLYLVTLLHRGGGCDMEAMRSQLLILDITDPAAPTLLGSYNSGLQIQSLFVDGTFAYMGETGTEELGFRIVNVSDPTHPFGFYMDPGTTAQAVWAGSGRAYFGRWSELKILDVSTSVPHELTNFTFTITNQIKGLQEVSNRLFLVEEDYSSNARFSVYDLEGNGKGLASINLANPPLSLTVSGNCAYLACGDKGFTVIDISDPARPKVVGSCTTPGYATQVQVFGSHAIVADNIGGVAVFNMQNPDGPFLVASYNTGLTTRTVRVAGSKAYLVSGDTIGTKGRGRLDILEISNPTKPVYLGGYEVARQIRALEIVSNLVYLGTSTPSESFLEIIDIRDPANAVPLSSVSFGSGDPTRMGLRISGKYAYASTTANGTQVFDVSIPAKPVLIPEAVMEGGYAIEVIGNRAYLGSDSSLSLYEVGNVKSPTVLGSTGFMQSGSGQACLRVQGHYAYSGLGWHGFLITDVNEPTNLVSAGSYDTLGEVNDLCVENQVLFVAEGWQGLEVFDVAQPGVPMPIGRLDTSGQLRGVQVLGNYGYLAEGGSGLGIINLPPGPVAITSDPANLNSAVGVPATLNVTAYGHGPLSYQWYAGESGDISHPILAANQSSFTIPAVAQRSAYWVRVSSSAGASDSRTAWINPVPSSNVELLSVWPGYRRGGAVDVRVVGQLAYVAAGGLQIWDFSVEGKPRLVGTFDPMCSQLVSLGVSGPMVFLACQEKGLVAVDVSRPETPVLAGTFELSSGYINKVVAVGSVAYTLGDSMRILDFSNPQAPRLLSVYSNNDSGLDVQGDYAYLANYNKSLRVLDVHDPTKPVEKALIDVESGAPNAVRVSGNYAYVTETTRSDGGTQYPGGLAVVDISNPLKPSVQGWFQMGSNNGATSVDVWGTQAFVADGGLQIIDVSNPSAPKFVGELRTNFWAQAVRVTESRVYLATGDTGLYEVEVSLGKEPLVLSSAQTAGYVQDAAIWGQQVVIADNPFGFRIVDVKDPQRPSLSGVYGTNNYVTAVTIKGSVGAFVADGAVQFVEASDPSRLTPVSNLELSAGSVVLTDTYAYFNSPDLTTVDIQDLAHPRLVGTFSAATGSRGSEGLAIVGNYSFLGQAWEGLEVVDMSSPESPRQVGSYFTDGPVSRVQVQDDLAFITLSSESPGVEIIDIRDVWHPTLISRIPMATAGDVAIQGNYLYASGDGLQIYDVSNPQYPVRVGSHMTGMQTSRLQLNGNLVYVAAGSYGLAVYQVAQHLQLDPPSIDYNGLTLTWPGTSGVRLQRTTSLSTPVWQDVPNSDGASMLQLRTNSPAGFFRLVRP